jgi:hypothetical protein
MMICEDVTPRAEPVEEDPEVDPTVAPETLVGDDDADVGVLDDDPHAATTMATADTPAARHILGCLLDQ